MDHVISDINRLCSSDIYLCFADDQVRCCRAFHHLLVMDDEVAAAQFELVVLAVLGGRSSQ